MRCALRMEFTDESNECYTASWQHGAVGMRDTNAINIYWKSLCRPDFSLSTRPVRYFLCCFLFTFGGLIWQPVWPICHDPMNAKNATSNFAEKASSTPESHGTCDATSIFADVCLTANGKVKFNLHATFCRILEFFFFVHFFCSFFSVALFTHLHNRSWLSELNTIFSWPTRNKIWHC